MSEQYFSIEHAIPINVIPLDDGTPLPSLSQLEAELPEPFRLSNAIAHLELGNNRAMRNLSEELHPLVEIINQQSQKINVLLGFVLSQQDDPASRHLTQRFGAGGLVFESRLPLQPHQLLRLKIFLQDEAAAVYCYGRVNHLTEQEERNLVEVEFAQIRDEDRELLVRTSLHVQSKQLKLRAQQRAGL